MTNQDDKHAEVIVQQDSFSTTPRFVVGLCRSIQQMLNTASMVEPAAASLKNGYPPSYQPQERQQVVVLHAERLRRESDISFLLESPEQFANLKRELRRSGAVTNSVLKHGIHFYARDHQRRAAKRVPGYHKSGTI